MNPGTTSSSGKNLEKAQGSPGLFSPKNLGRNVLDFVFDLIFPPRCAGCEKVDVSWCAVCQADIDAVAFPEYVAPLPPLSHMAATGVHTGKLQNAIWSLKYENGQRLAIPLGDRLAARFMTLEWKIDMVVPVPMHTDRLRQRGYNQAELLAQQAARMIDLPCVPGAITRPRFTQSQVGLNAAERLVNMQDAFIADGEVVAGQSLLLIDDVYTTGATLSGCAEAALAAGAVAVYGLTITAARHN